MVHRLIVRDITRKVNRTKEQEDTLEGNKDQNRKQGNGDGYYEKKGVEMFCVRTTKNF